jgi:hypothetical protein
LSIQDFVDTNEFGCGSAAPGEYAKAFGQERYRMYREPA